MNLFHRNTIKPLRIALPIVCWLTAACTTTTTQSFDVTKNPQVETSYIASDADFGKYDRLFASDMAYRQAVFGLFYVAILVAGLVGAYISDRQH